MAALLCQAIISEQLLKELTTALTPLADCECEGQEEVAGRKKFSIADISVSDIEARKLLPSIEMRRPCSHVSCDVTGLGMLYSQLSGRRLVATMAVKDLGGLGDLSDASSYVKAFQNVSPEAAAETSFRVTVLGAGDILWVPSGHILAEKVLSDTFTIKCPSKIITKVRRLFLELMSFD